MKRLALPVVTAFIVFCLMVATARQAYGYVDPGSGLVALQGLASAAAAFAYYMRRRILLLFRTNHTLKPGPAKEGN